MAKIKTHLILGGARSGKTKFAEGLAIEESKHSKTTPTYIATAKALDPEMEDRINRHKEERANTFLTKECPLNLSEPLLSASRDDVILVDCLTLFVTNLMCSEVFDQSQISNFLNAVKLTRARLIIVSNETSLGIVPDNKLARDFRDISGKLNQNVASIADRVTMMLAGIAVPIKQ